MNPEDKADYADAVRAGMDAEEAESLVGVTAMEVKAAREGDPLFAELTVSIDERAEDCRALYGKRLLEKVEREAHLAEKVVIALNTLNPHERQDALKFIDLFRDFMKMGIVRSAAVQKTPFGSLFGHLREQVGG